LQEFVDAYNAIVEQIQTELHVTDASIRASSLSGDSNVRGLQERLGDLVSTEVAGIGAVVRSLADLGLETSRTGTLSIDDETFDRALCEPGAVNALFARATTGITALVGDLVDAHTDATGILTSRSDSLSAQIADLDDDLAAAQRHVDMFREKLVRDFAAMERVISALNSASSYLGSLRVSTFGGDDS
jgi:flagellar hook-associated protein 2